uniref:Vesicle transport protein n=1 Tax=Aureoumbra lagunensis TaxID=44058 RepID=A0A7S3NGZ0_9STRA|mmetsp:Transcript_9875/g.12390  ORF Transcript_9875/g.12390 Transcript_9875/m.12390 type:complete len:361 (-) Transcript_9875:49-1131(-)
MSAVNCESALEKIEQKEEEVELSSPPSSTVNGTWLGMSSLVGGKKWEEVLEVTQSKFLDARAASLDVMNEARAKSIELASTANKFSDILAARVKERLALEDIETGRQVSCNSTNERREGYTTEEAEEENQEEEAALLSSWSLTNDLSSRFSGISTNDLGVNVKNFTDRINSNTNQFGQNIAATINDRSSKMRDNVRSLSSNLASGFSSQIADTRECGLTRPQRFRYYVALLLASTFFFGLAFQFILLPSKFAAAFSFGTITSLAAKAMLNGPYTQLRLMFALRRLPYTIALLASTALTLYLTFSRANFIFTLSAAIANVAALLYYLFADTPGGKQGIRLLFKFILNTLRLMAKPFLYAFE